MFVGRGGKYSMYCLYFHSLNLEISVLCSLTILYTINVNRAKYAYKHILIHENMCPCVDAESIVIFKSI